MEEPKAPATMGDFAKEMMNTVHLGIRSGIKERFNQSYKNPFDGVISSAIDSCKEDLHILITEAITECVGDPKFVDEIRAAVRTQLAKTLVIRFGGELEKEVNRLKSNPDTRARINLAITEICGTTA